MMNRLFNINNKNSRSPILFLLLLSGTFLIAYVFINPLSAFASFQSDQNDILPLVINLDKQSYLSGDTIVLSGRVKAVDLDSPVTIQILNPYKNLIRVEQITVSNDGTFALSTLAKGPLWIYDGEYTVKAQYGFSHIANSLNFNFLDKTPQEDGVFQVKDPKSTQIFDVNYTITNGKVKEMVINHENLALDLIINSTNDGTLSLKIPRSLIDAKNPEGSDTNFLILVDENEVEDSDQSDSDFRTVTVDFTKNTSKIELIGTQIVPEFGHSVTPLVIILIALVIIISKRTRFYKNMI